MQPEVQTTTRVIPAGAPYIAIDIQGALDVLWLYITLLHKANNHK